MANGSISVAKLCRTIVETLRRALGSSRGENKQAIFPGTRWNWFDDQSIRTCAYIAGISGVLFIARSLTFPRPVVDLRALSNRNFALGCFLSFVTGVGIFSTIYLTPLFLGYVRGFSAWQTGLTIFSTGAASLIGVPIYIVLAKKFDIRWLMMLGLASFGLAMWSYTFITHDWGADQLLIPQIQKYRVGEVQRVTDGRELRCNSLIRLALDQVLCLCALSRTSYGCVQLSVSLRTQPLIAR